MADLLHCLLVAILGLKVPAGRFSYLRLRYSWKKEEGNGAWKRPTVGGWDSTNLFGGEIFNFHGTTLYGKKAEGRGVLFLLIIDFLTFYSVCKSYAHNLF